MLQERNDTLAFRKFSETPADIFRTFYHHAPQNDASKPILLKKDTKSINFSFSDKD